MVDLIHRVYFSQRQEHTQDAIQMIASRIPLMAYCTSLVSEDDPEVRSQCLDIIAHLDPSFETLPSGFVAPVIADESFRGQQAGLQWLYSRIQERNIEIFSLCLSADVIGRFVALLDDFESSECYLGILFHMSDPPPTIDENEARSLARAFFEPRPALLSSESTDEIDAEGEPRLPSISVRDKIIELARSHPDGLTVVSVLTGEPVNLCAQAQGILNHLSERWPDDLAPSDSARTW
jgi:hypothetical protein